MAGTKGKKYDGKERGEVRGKEGKFRVCFLSVLKFDISFTSYGLMTYASNGLGQDLKMNVTFKRNLDDLYNT